MSVPLGSQVFKKIRRNSLWIMFILSVIYVVIFFFIEYNITKKAIEADKSSVRQQVVQVFESETKRLVSFYSTRVKCHLAAPEALHAMESRDPDAIYQSAKPKFDILNSTNPYITHMHFYAPDGTSLMRVHNKEKYGDNIAAQRPMVARAIETQGSVSGFEEGVYGLVFRVIEPAFNHQGEYIGSLEFGFQPLYFEKIINELFSDMKVGLIVPKNTLKIYQDTGRFESYQDVYLIGHDREDIKPFIHYSSSSDQSRTVKVNGESYLLINDVFLKDFEGQPFIQLVMLKDLKALYARFYSEVKGSAFLGLLLLLVMWLASHFVLGYFARNASNLHDELGRSHAKMNAIFNTSAEGLAVLDTDGNFLDANTAFCELMGYSNSDLQSISLKSVISEKDQVNVGNVLQMAYSGKNIEKQELYFVTKAGIHLLLELSMAALVDEGHVLMTCRDITQLRKQQKEIEDYVAVVDKYVVTSKTNLKGDITYVSEAFSAISGYSKNQLMGLNHSIVRHSDMSDSVYKSLWETISNGQTWVGDIKNKRKDGTSYWVSAVISPDVDDEENIVGYTAIRQDITDRKRVEELSITDELTGLFNRRHYIEVFDSVFNQRKREKLPFLFALIDVDYFKKYNDTYGHPAGDEALKCVAQVLKEGFQRNGDFLFRLGGEEFGAILNLDKGADAEPILNRLHKQIEQLNIVHKANAPSNQLTVSVGACLVNDYAAGLDEAAIYKKADLALYRAKDSGRNKSIIDVV